MKIVKKKANSTYKGKDGKERHYINYYVVDDNGHSIQVKPAFTKDIVRLDMISVYEK